MLHGQPREFEWAEGPSPLPFQCLSRRLPFVPDSAQTAMSGLEGRPVSSCLRQNLFVASLETSLPDIETVFVEKSISCVPVVRIMSCATVVYVCSRDYLYSTRIRAWV